LTYLRILIDGLFDAFETNFRADPNIIGHAQWNDDKHPSGGVLEIQMHHFAIHIPRVNDTFRLDACTIRSQGDFAKRHRSGCAQSEGVDFRRLVFAGRKRCAQAYLGDSFFWHEYRRKGEIDQCVVAVSWEIELPGDRAAVTARRRQDNRLCSTIRRNEMERFGVFVDALMIDCFGRTFVGRPSNVIDEDLGACFHTADVNKFQNDGTSDRQIGQRKCLNIRRYRIDRKHAL